MIEKWDQRFLDLAEHVATWSKDPSTKVGAVVVNKKKQVIGLGFNGFPRGVFDDDNRYEDKQTKYLFVSHAERNALDNSFADTDGCTIYTTLFPCNECAKGIIQKGIKRIVSPRPDMSKPFCNFPVSELMFRESGVKVDFID